MFTVFLGLGNKHSFEMEIEFLQREPSESESRIIEGLDSVVGELYKPS